MKRMNILSKHPDNSFKSFKLSLFTVSYLVHTIKVMTVFMAMAIVIVKAIFMVMIIVMMITTRLV